MRLNPKHQVQRLKRRRHRLRRLNRRPLLLTRQHLPNPARHLRLLAKRLLLAVSHNKTGDLMKLHTIRSVALAATLAGLLGLAGCDKGADSSAPETPAASSEAPATPAPAAEPAAPADSGTTPAPATEAPASGGSQPQ